VKITPFKDLWDQAIPECIELDLMAGPNQQGPYFFNRPTDSGRNYFTMSFLLFGEKNDLGKPKYGFEVERWQASGGDRWRTRECRLAAGGTPCWSEDLAPKPAWHRWNIAQRKSGRFAVWKWPKAFQPLGHAAWWLSDQLWTLGEDHSGWKWDGIEAMQARHEQIWSGGQEG
jgi:hypothetical protein